MGIRRILLGKKLTELERQVVERDNIILSQKLQIRDMLENMSDYYCEPCNMIQSIKVVRLATGSLIVKCNRCGKDLVPYSIYLLRKMKKRVDELEKEAKAVAVQPPLDDYVDRDIEYNRRNEALNKARKLSDILLGIISTVRSRSRQPMWLISLLDEAYENCGGLKDELEFHRDEIYRESKKSS